MQKVQKIITNLLLAFVLVSIGFAIGKNSTMRSTRSADDSADTDARGKRVEVYYLHSTFRCSTCNTIESMAHDVLTKRYAAELKTGDIVWIEDDFQTNEALAKQFGVVSSCVVVALKTDGKITDYKRLDKVWTLMQDPPAFNKYISDAVNAFLPKVEGGRQ